MGPDAGLGGGLDHDRIGIVEVVEQRGMARRERRLAAAHELHQRDAEPFGLGNVDVEIRAPDQLAVILLVEETVNHDDPARKRRQTLHQAVQIEDVLRCNTASSSAAA
jgi:hypothetical protein